MVVSEFELDFIIALRRHAARARFHIYRLPNDVGKLTAAARHVQLNVMQLDPRALQRSGSAKERATKQPGRPDTTVRDVRNAHPPLPRAGGGDGFPDDVAKP